MLDSQFQLVKTYIKYLHLIVPISKALKSKADTHLVVSHNWCQINGQHQMTEMWLKSTIKRSGADWNYKLIQSTNTVVDIVNISSLIYYIWDVGLVASLYPTYFRPLRSTLKVRYSAVVIPTNSILLNLRLLVATYRLGSKYNHVFEHFT